MTRRARANTASDAVEISSGDEEITPTHAEEEPISAAKPEEASEETEVMSPTPTVQEEAPMEVEHVSPAEGSPDREVEEERYQSERKRKGKASVQRKQTAKKIRPANIGVVVREPAQEEDTNDKDYSSSEESESEDKSLEEEEIQERQLPANHWELVHPPLERLEYLLWQVELDDDLMEAMKHYNT